MFIKLNHRDRVFSQAQDQPSPMPLVDFPNLDDQEAIELAKKE